MLPSSPFLATWVDGFATLGMLGLAYFLASVISAGLVMAGAALRRLRQPRCGRRICAWCKHDLGAAKDIPAGAVTHGLCPQCLAREFGDFCSNHEN